MRPTCRDFIDPNPELNVISMINATHESIVYATLEDMFDWCCELQEIKGSKKDLLK